MNPKISNLRLRQQNGQNGNNTGGHVEDKICVESSLASRLPIASVALPSSPRKQSQHEKRKNNQQQSPISSRRILATLVFVMTIFLLLHLYCFRRRRSASIVYTYYSGYITFQHINQESSLRRRLFVPFTLLKYNNGTLQGHALQQQDYGGLTINSVEGSPSWIRTIQSTRDLHIFEEERNTSLTAMNVFPNGVETRYEDDDEYAQKYKYTSRRNNWRSRSYPNCNSAYELFGLDRVGDHRIEFKGYGAFRQSWLFSSRAEEFIIKAIRIQYNVNHNIKYQIQKEAIVMERLTLSPRIVDIFGFCGTTIIAEHMSKHVTGDIVWGSKDWEGTDGYMNQEDLDELQVNDVHPMNNLTALEKINMAIVMAESIADIHGFSGGVIIHGDIHPIQWLQNSQGQIKLNDFNNGEILDFCPTDNQYCKVHRCYGGTYRSPEELRCVDSHEAMDTYSMGNNIYILLTGLWPFYQYDFRYSEIIKDKLVKDAERPYVDIRYRNRSQIESGLIKIMEQCWVWDMDERISIFQVLRQLYALRDSSQNAVQQG